MDGKKTKVLFLCLGNICRSVAAEEVFRTQVQSAGMENQVEVDSAGLIDYHEGELADPRMRRHSARRGYRLTHRSRPVRARDFRDFDMIVAMDAANVRGLRAVAPTEKDMEKVVMMADFLTRHVADSVPDPYYGGESDFEYVLDLLEDACQGLLQELKKDTSAA